MGPAAPRGAIGCASTDRNSSEAVAKSRIAAYAARSRRQGRRGKEGLDGQENTMNERPAAGARAPTLALALGSSIAARAQSADARSTRAQAAPSAPPTRAPSAEPSA